MSFNFPNSPIEGQTFTPVGGYQYVWTDGKWRVVESPQVRATAETRSRIVNGAMQVSQEWGNTLIGAGYPADQWNHAFVTTGGVTVQRIQTATPNKSINRLRFIVTTADTSLDATELWVVVQSIEGIRMADFGPWGYPGPRQIIVRFGFKGPAGTYSVSIRNSPSTRTYLASFTISAGQANTDTEQTFIVPGDTTGTWAIGTATGLMLAVTLASGSTYLGAVGWQAGDFLGVTGMSNGLATVGNTFELFDVGLYLDPDATGLTPRWTMPDEAQELQACMRYWQRHMNAINDPATWFGWPLSVYMRANPVITGGGAGFAIISAQPEMVLTQQTSRGLVTLTFNARM